MLLYQNTTAMNYLSNDELERYWFQYKAEAEPHGISLEQFCNTHKISWRAMDNWRRQTKSKVVPVAVEGTPDSAEPVSGSNDSPKDRSSQSRFVSCKHRNTQSGHPTEKTSDTEEKSDGEETATRIMVTIKTTNGLSVFQKNLRYGQLRLLVERLEGLC